MLSIHDGLATKICTISYGSSGSRPRDYTKFSWGDGKESHDIDRFIAYSSRNDRSKYYTPFDKYSDFINADIRPLDLKPAVVISVHDSLLHSEPIIHKEHKLWKEWLNALDAACKIMEER